MVSHLEIANQRMALYGVYGNEAKWVTKVNLMPPAQVTALYLKFRAQGKIKN